MWLAAMFSEIGLHFMFLGQMIYGCIQQSGMNTRKQIYVLHKNLSLPCNNIHSTHTYTQSLNTHPPTNKANSTWGKCFGFWLAGIYSTTCKLYLRWMEATPKILLRNLISDPIVVWKTWFHFKSLRWWGKTDVPLSETFHSFYLSVQGSPSYSISIILDLQCQ